MNELIKLVIEYKTSKSDYIYENIVENLKPLIISKMNKVPKYYRDDFYQELLECLLRVINTIKIRNCNLISADIFTKENLELLKKNNFKNVNKVLKNNYMSSFIEKYEKDLLLSAFNSEDKLSLFLDEFTLFCNGNQFINYLNVSFDRLVNLFYRKRNKLKKIRFISLDIQVNECVDLIDLIPYQEPEDVTMFYDESLLSKKDLEFLNLFYADNKILKIKEVAKILNVTPQAVSIRLKRLKNKYKKAFYNKYRKV